MRTPLILALGALALAGCNPQPNPEARARRVWLQQLKAQDPYLAHELAVACAEENGGFSFSPKKVGKMIDCMQQRHEGSPRDWHAEGVALYAAEGISVQSS